MRLRAPQAQRGDSKTSASVSFAILPKLADEMDNSVPVKRGDNCGKDKRRDNSHAKQIVFNALAPCLMRVFHSRPVSPL